MERRAGAIVSHISGEPPLQRRRVDPVEIGGLVNEAALGEHFQEFGFRRVHRVSLLSVTEDGEGLPTAVGIHKGFPAQRMVSLQPVLG